jgi:LmbE family N-acetylglucosaminyl deacetylase
MWAVIALASAASFNSPALTSSDAPMPLNISKFKNKTVMFVGGHPDDIESHCGGLSLLLAAQGTKLVNLIITNGDKYCSLESAGATNCTASISSPEIAAMRAKEAAAAAAVTGATLVMLQGYDDGMLYSYPEVAIRRDITRQVRLHQPFAVFTHKAYPDFSVPSFDGWTDVGYHTDHQDTARHVMNVVKNAAGNKLTFTDLGPPHGPSEVGCRQGVWSYIALQLVTQLALLVL